MLRLYRGRSLRGKFFRVTLVGVVLPLLLVGLWLSESARRSGGEGFLRNGSIAILIVAAGSLIIATVLTRRMARSMEELALATDAVAGGDLDRRVSDSGDDEIARVGRAFNTMTESLRATLGKLSQQEALAAVGEFAASLAHEVRNPLTSIRIDLQRVEEQLPATSPLHTQLARALREVQRLDQTVAGALRIARSGSINAAIVDIRIPLNRAIEIAMPAFEQLRATLTIRDLQPAPLEVRGDADALEQLFLNLFLNAAQALRSHGSATTTIALVDETIAVDIADDGPGVEPERLARVFEPFFSTKPEGTGLGLPVARQIVKAHGGSITITSVHSEGTTIHLRFPVAPHRELEVPGFFRW
jgi:signal transduction histidine kinase